MYKGIKNIGLLVNIRHENKVLIKDQLANIEILKNAFLIIKNDRIVEWGEMKNIENIFLKYNINKIYDANKGCIMPMFVDSHTHLVFAGSRENEFVLKLKGKSYQEIVQTGGGINNTANAIDKISAEKLLEESMQKLNHLIGLGTGGIEIKSGYGLNVKNEIKILQTIAALKKYSPIPIKSTFLGAHTIPIKYKNNPTDYIHLVINKMLPLIAKDNLADYIDVFCDKGFYTPTQTEIICKAALKYGLKPRLHVNQ
ncbi:MAG: imidazolonepropionase, partial [Sediminibacterium sp.]|nr:imidazolonepropionase [Sediminibacterium sp.]